MIEYSITRDSESQVFAPTVAGSSEPWVEVFGRVDLNTGKFESITFCPGYLRGLTFVGDYAVVTMSKPRRDRTFKGLSLDEALAKRDADAQCGLQVIDLRSGEVAQWVRVEGMVNELHDVVTLPGVRRPMALGFKTDEIAQLLTLDAEGTLDHV